MAVEKILLQFEADIKDLKSELNQVKSKMSDTEKEGKKVGSSLTKSFTNVGKAIGAAFSVQVLIQFTKKAVELYDIQAKAEASLLQALKGREDVQRRLMAQASELQKITLFGDEETIKAQAMLAKFGMTETQIKRLIPLIQDYATISGQDLVSAADMVARSVGTSTNALTRYGIEITGAVGSSERLESAISNLNAQVGGQAVAAAQAGSSAIEQFNMAWGDFAELVGEDVLPAIIAITGELKIFLEQLIELKSAGDDGFLKRLFTEGVIGAIGFARDMGKARERLENATDYEGIFNKAQDDFAKFVKNNKEKYSTLVDAATAYADDLNAELRRVNRQWADGQISDDDAFKIRKRISIVQEAIDAYVKDMDNGVRITDKLNKKTLNLSESLDKMPKIVQALYDPFAVLPDAVERFGQAMVRIFGENEDPNKAVTDFYDNLEKSIKSADDANIEFFENLEEKRQEDQDSQDQWLNNLQNGLQAAQNLFGAYGQLLIEIGGKQSALADFGRQLAFFEIATAQAVATANAVKLVSTSAKTPIDYFVFLATILSSIAVNIGKARSLIEKDSVPQFATGVVDLKGAGTETSDSIHAKLSRGESVITAKGTRQDKGLFEAANKLQLEKYINENYVLPALIKVNKERSAMFDDYRLYRELRNSQGNENKNFDRLIRTINRKKTRYDWN